MFQAISNSSIYSSNLAIPPFRFQAVEYDGRFFVNPGSATGAWTGLWNGCVLQGPLIISARLTQILQGPDTFICAHGHTGPSRRHVRVSTGRWRSSSGENRVPEGRGSFQGAASERSLPSERPGQSPSGPATTECVVVFRDSGCRDTRVAYCVSEGCQREAAGVATINVHGFL